MIFHFDGFELDEARRELRRRGRPIEMQPRVFDVLLYLVRHRDRVVSKDELLSAIWPEVIVTDSSIMRAVSVIRSLLRAETRSDAIRTFSRQGYRFVASVDDERQHRGEDPLLARARSAHADGKWASALESYQKISHTTGLAPCDLEQWAQAALCQGRPKEAIYPLERAVAAHVQDADRVGAARAAQTLANIHLEDRELPIAKGWLRRAGVFLGDEHQEAREHGMQLWLNARVALMEGDLTACLDLAKAAEGVARRLEDPDIEALSLVYRAHIELATGDIRAGLVHLDESGAAVLAGAVSPWVCGYIFCSVIWAYLDRGDTHRAGQWTDQFFRWENRHASYGYSGLCRLHRGEILCVQGKLTGAESEISKARELLSENARYAEGDAFRVLGEIRLLRGDCDGAQDAFRKAHELGWHPLPGWALVQAANRRFAAAIRSLQRGLQAPGWADGQRRAILLAHLGCIAAQAGDLPLARSALDELIERSDLRNTAGSEALYHQARAGLAFAEHRLDDAIEAQRQALSVWLDAGSRINAAHARLRLAEFLSKAGDLHEAELEIDSAEKAFAAMNADPMVRRCRAARKALVTRRDPVAIVAARGGTVRSQRPPRPE
ncbi:MAG: winged helix-turn-helix domain-containing protein [Opitutaceae bacterium]|nr:winged helix-turn-helix domain-containing protein [Opitutaceae bacterium]